MADYYSGFLGVPNGGAKYRIHLVVNVASQDVVANTSTLDWALYLEKDRSYRGFYDYPDTSWGGAINGVGVLSGSGPRPNTEWPGWSTWTIGGGSITVTHDTAGALTVPLSFFYQGPNRGWSVGYLGISDSLALPTIPRATEPTVTPSPATVGSTVTIALPRKVGSYTHDVTWTSGALSGTIGTGLGASTTWTVPNVMGEFPGKKQGSIVITAVTKSGATVIGSRQVTLFARTAPALIVGGDQIETDPLKQFDVRARLVSYSGGAWGPGKTVPVSGLTLVDPFSATATCTMQVSGLLTNFDDGSIVDIDVFMGTDWLYTGHRLVMARDEGDEIDPTKMKTYSGVEFIDYMLAKAYIQADYVWGEGTPESAAAASPGEMMRVGIVDAKSRGWGPTIDFEFTAGATSYGDTWANTGLKRRFNKGTPLSQMLSSLVTDGLVEYRTEYRGNKAYLVLMNPGTGSNFAVPGAIPTVNFSLASLSRAPRRKSSQERLTAVTVAGDDSIQVTRRQAPFDPNVFGQMEGWVAASGVSTNDEANRIGDNALRDNSSPTNERTFEYASSMVASVFYPYYVFVGGDWVLIPDGDIAVQDRISQITIAKGSDATLLTVLTGDRILSGTATLAKRQAAQTGGSIAGGGQSTPSPLDSRIPRGPVIDTMTSVGYWNSDGAARSEVTLSWAAVTEALNGSSISVDLYEVWWRPSVGDALWALRGSTDQLTITLGDWDVLRNLEFRVRARSAAGIFGEFSENEEHTTIAPPVDLAGPQIADLYTDGVGSIYIVWAGIIGADPAPLRLAYVVAEVSTDGGLTYTTTGTPLAGPGTLVLNMGNLWGDYLVRLRGYDRLGNPGDASDPEAITLVDPTSAAAIPVPPTDLTAVAGAAWDASGFLPEAWFDLSWTAPTEDTSGNPITIVGYDILGLRSDETIERFLTTTVTTGARVRVGNGESWTFRVRAASNFGGVSAPSDSITATADATISAAAAPTAPTLEQYAGILRIRWSGNGMVPQIKYVYATIATNPGGPFTRAGMPLVGAGEVVVPGLATGVTYYAKIVMVDELGNSSTSVASAGLLLDPITGTTIQTSPIANTGIKMTSGALTAYDASGNPTFILNAATGEVWIAPYDAVFDLGASGTVATTGAPTTGIAISSEASSFNTFIHPSGVQIRNDQTALSWWEADATDASLVNFFSPRAVIDQRMRVGDFEQLREAKAVGTRLVTRYKGA